MFYFYHCSDEVAGEKSSWFSIITHLNVLFLCHIYVCIFLQPQAFTFFLFSPSTFFSFQLSFEFASSSAYVHLRKIENAKPHNVITHSSFNSEPWIQNIFPLHVNTRELWKKDIKDLV